MTLDIVLFIVGWLLYVASQAQNSVASKSNGLPPGWPGIVIWLHAHSVDLARRAFFSALAYGFLVHTLATKVEQVGFNVSGAAIAGTAGYAANTLLYQFFGLFPGLRVEMSELAPPSTPASGNNSSAGGN